MISKHNILFNNKLLLGDAEVLNSAGIKSAAEFYREFLTRSLIPSSLSEHPFKFCLHTGKVCYHFEPGTYENELLQLAFQKCVRASAEVDLISTDLVVIKIIFYEKGKEDWYATFQVDFEIESGELHEASAGMNVAN